MKKQKLDGEPVLPQGHELKHVKSKYEVRHGEDSDLDEYEQIDQEGNVVARYICKESMLIYRLPETTTTWYKITDE